jgi:class 3 adenylate cyclase
MTAGAAELQSAVAAAEGFLRRGEPLLAYNAVQEALLTWPDSLRLRQLKGLALARSGDIEQANVLLSQIADEGSADAETLGMLARTHKDLAAGAVDSARRVFHLDAAFRLYHQAYAAALAGGSAAEAYYTGINAATLAVLRDDLETARRIAADVRDICMRARAAAGAAGDYWLEATLGEAALILGDSTAAAGHYASAVSLARGDFGSLSSTCRQAELVADRLTGDSTWIGSVLKIPPVVMFTGHMIDQAGRATPRFPPKLEAAVYAAIREQLSAIRPVAIYGSAACGADLICLEAMRNLGGETHIVLPFPPDEFHRVSVDFAGEDWSQRFDRALLAAESVTIASDHRARGSTSTFEYANLILSGMGRLRAQMLQTGLLGLAIWDQQSAVRAGGAASLVRLWEAQGIDIRQVDLHGLRGAATGTTDRPAPAIADEQLPEGFRHEIRAMLFADVVGYSKLNEDQTPDFVKQFLGAVADLNRRTACPPEHAETAGDGLYMVFGSAGDAGNYALELSELVATTDWAAAGMPNGLKIRIALHCGPVYCGHNPVTGSPLYTGPHTSRTARIEPITPPGQVYASSAFAAVAAANGVQGLTMRYIGRMPLAKGFGTLGLYHVSSRR